MMPVVDGTVEAGFEIVRDAFAASFHGKPNMGAALAIRHRGVPVVDLWGGVADERAAQLWRRNTASVIFSCTKGLVAILAARLVQERRLAYSAPVVEYWPEFGAAGKSTVTVGDLLAHRAGLSAPRESLSTDEVLDWSTVVSRLATQEPLWDPGTAHAYHAITYGWLVGEVIRRITGTTVGQYFADLITTPLRVDAWIGLPDEYRDRVAHLQVGPTLQAMVRQQAAARVDGVVDWSDRAMTLGQAFPPELVGPDRGFNNARVRAAEIPGAGGIATARALATIWSATVGETDGVRLLSDNTVALATEVQTEGSPIWSVPGPWPRWGMGFQLDSEARRYTTAHAFGHDGAGGQSAFADPDLGIGFAFLTNQMEAINDFRATTIIDALRTALRQP